MTASEEIDAIIANLTDWRGPVLARIRRVIHEADPEVSEEVKWRGAPVWWHDGNIVVANAFKGKVKLMFPDGADLPDPDALFNNGLEGKRWRAIDIFENDEIREPSLRALVRAAVEHNRAKVAARSAAGRRRRAGAGSGER